MTNEELIELFGGWINSLPDDTRVLQAAVEAEDTPRDAKLLLVGGLAYLLRKIDIVPDYLTGVGVVDDAFVLRMAAAAAVEAGATDGALSELGGTVEPIQGYLDDLYAGLVDYVKTLPSDPVRGRTADKILDDADAYAQFARELGDELDSYAPKPIADGDRALREIKSFIKAKLEK